MDAFSALESWLEQNDSLQDDGLLLKSIDATI
jgi:hypothetical protein